jgi:predicted ABC-type transport system involved in lysophospholipase L1 biosynthesis ATPase subunit
LIEFSKIPRAVLRSKLPVGSSARTTAGLVTKARAKATRRKTALGIFELLTDLKKELNMAMLIVTHDEHLAQAADSILHMQDDLFRGKIKAQLSGL